MIRHCCCHHCCHPCPCPCTHPFSCSLTTLFNCCLFNCHCWHQSCRCCCCHAYACPSSRQPPCSCVSILYGISTCKLIISILKLWFTLTSVFGFEDTCKNDYQLCIITYLCNVQTCGGESEDVHVARSVASQCDNCITITGMGIQVWVFDGLTILYPYPYPQLNPHETCGYTHTHDIHQPLSL